MLGQCGVRCRAQLREQRILLLGCDVWSRTWVRLRGHTAGGAILHHIPLDTRYVHSKGTGDDAHGLPGLDGPHNSLSKIH
jgi:hypothetical protein